MDRFIEFVREFLLIFSEYLKSNMDRFIDKRTLQKQPNDCI